MLSKREQSVADRKQRILAAAGTIIARDGYDALTTRGLAEEAGVTPPTLYNLFGDKTAIISAMACATIEELWDRLEFDRLATPLAMTDALLGEAHAQVIDAPNYSRGTFLALERLGIAFAYHPTREDAGAHAARRSVAMAEYVCLAAKRSGQLREGVNTLELAVQMFSAFRAPLDDWLHDAIDSGEMLRRQRIGFYTLLCAYACDDFRAELMEQIEALSLDNTARELA